MHGPAGFDQALVSKGLLLLTGSFSFGALLARKVGLFTLDLDAVARGEVWRLFTHQLVWSSSSELVLGSMLLYTLRLFERQFGARKFAACALFLQLVATAVQASVLAFSRGVVGASGWSFAPGPYALCFGLLAMFVFDIPTSTPFKLFGVPLSDKVFVYLLGAQVALAGWPGPAYTALIGLVLGALYRIEALPFHRLRIPMAISNACGSVCRPILSGSFLRSIAGLPAGGGGGGQRFGGGGQMLGGAPRAAGGAARGVGAAGAAAGGAGGPDGYARVAAAEGGDHLPARVESPRPEILNDSFGGGHVAAEADPAALQQLVSMGFTEQRARGALIATRNNLPQATNLLLGS